MSSKSFQQRPGLRWRAGSWLLMNLYENVNIRLSALRHILLLCRANLISKPFWYILTHTRGYRGRTWGNVTMEVKFSISWHFKPFLLFLWGWSAQWTCSFPFCSYRFPHSHQGAAASFWTLSSRRWSACEPEGALLPPPLFITFSLLFIQVLREARCPATASLWSLAARQMLAERIAAPAAAVQFTGSLFEAPSLLLKLTLFNAQCLGHSAKLSATPAAHFY